MVEQQELADSYTTFVRDFEPRLRAALCAAFGADVGRESTAEALAFGWEHWDRIRAMANPAGYLYGVGRNRARRQRKRVCLPPPPVESEPWIEPGLSTALEKLPQRQRVAVMLVVGLDWSYSEVADLLDVSKSTIQVQVRRAMQKLRRDLGVKS